MEANWVPSEENSNKQVDEEYYEVESILDDVKNTNSRMFKVRWKGEKTNDQWLSEKYLDCPKVIHRYFQNKKIKKATSMILNENLQEEVLGVKILDGKIFFTLRTKNGKVKEVPNDVMKAKHLSTLVRYYESNLTFTEKQVYTKIYD